MCERVQVCNRWCVCVQLSILTLDFDLGKHQLTKDVVDNVVLPKWAKTPEEFIYKVKIYVEIEFSIVGPG